MLLKLVIATGMVLPGEKTDGAQRERQLQVRVRNENDAIVSEESA